MPFRILLLEDDSTTQEMIKEILEDNLDSLVECVGDDQSARNSIARQIPDLLITDIFHPGDVPVGLLGEIRGAPQTEQLPVIVMSGNLGRALVETSLLQLGFVAALRKPFIWEEFLSAVQRALRLKTPLD